MKALPEKQYGPVRFASLCTSPLFVCRLRYGLWGLLFVMTASGALVQKSKSGAFPIGTYPVLPADMGYWQADIRNRLNQAYHNLFEGSHKIYFEAGDSMAYVSDIRNHDARTGCLSYGMMVAVQLKEITG